MKKEKPKGECTFLCVSDDRLGDLDDKYICFANGGVTTPLNGRSKNATPSLHFPRDAEIRLLGESNMRVMEISTTGVKMVFGE